MTSNYGNSKTSCGLIAGPKEVSDMNKNEQQDRVVRRLERLARKAYTADDAFRDALDKAKERPDWQDICDRHGINPDSNDSDWKA
jgi:hypothetical protein